MRKRQRLKKQQQQQQQQQQKRSNDKKHCTCTCTCSILYCTKLFCTTIKWNFQKRPSYRFYGGNVVCVPVHFFFNAAFSPWWPLAFLSSHRRYKIFMFFFQRYWSPFFFYVLHYLTKFNRSNEKIIIRTIKLKIEILSIYIWFLRIDFFSFNLTNERYGHCISVR